MQQMRQMQAKVQNSPEMRMMQNLHQSIGASGGRPTPQQMQQMQRLQQQLQNSPMMSNMQMLQQQINQPMNRSAPQRQPMQGARRNYNEGGMACASGCKVEMKKGGKTKKAAPRKSAAKSKSKAEDKMVEQLLEQMVAQTAQTGRVPGVPMGDMMQEPMMQGRPMPAPNARAVPASSQSPLIAMMHGGKARK